VSEHAKMLPVLPLKNSVLFPHLLMPLSVGRPASVAAVEAALASEEKEILVVAQRDASVEAPVQHDLYGTGTRAVIKKMARSSESTLELIVLGVERVMLLRVEETEPFLSARIQPSPVAQEQTPEVEALRHEVLELAARVVSLAQPQAPSELNRLLVATDDSLRLSYLLASMLGLELDKEQQLLEAQSTADALRLMHSYLAHEVQVLELRSKIASAAQTEMGKEQRDYMLRQQMRAIQGRNRAAAGARGEGGPARGGQEGSTPRAVAAGAAADRRAGLPRHPHLPRVRAGAAVACFHRGQSRPVAGAPGAR
jgi:ATP-dependent Lon protease